MTGWLWIIVCYLVADGFAHVWAVDKEIKFTRGVCAFALFNRLWMAGVIVWAISALP